jgi:hypothetical protein
MATAKSNSATLWIAQFCCHFFPQTGGCLHISAYQSGILSAGNCPDAEEGAGQCFVSQNHYGM